MSIQASFASGSGYLREYSNAALFLAELDSFYRTGSPNVLDYALHQLQAEGTSKGYRYFSQNSTVTGSALASNVEQLACYFESFAHSTEIEHAWLNPNFGNLSEVVKGADADLIYDDHLIDFKTYSKLSYKHLDWAQVLGYAAMAQHVGMKISTVGLYFARFDLLVTLELNRTLQEQLPLFLDVITSSASYDLGK